MQRLLISLALLVVLCGCAVKHPVQPQFTQRHCPAGSVPIIAVIYHGTVFPAGSICQAVLNHKLVPNAYFWRDQFPSCNPFLDADCDEAGKDKPRLTRVWWKFWQRHEADLD